ncbi:hypothetical protein CIW83_04680 [Tissierella sp. P1]|uniref:hypothetical protein n=1 Tax=Tissierella TaxID=41273 RepID=UPI000BA01FBC|nr:hypothetical protein [Tissierella sp. P1]MDU5080183.1 hypothetical protein [Bacillota bacterium]OZV13177.1 hypothetical protein CIW83_04680 [Tissierella sp. P1]
MDLRLDKKILYSNIKIISFNTMALALVYMGAIYLMINKNDLLEDSIIFIGEQLISPIGIAMFVRTALIEDEYGVSEMVYSKVYPYWRIILYRIVITSIQLSLVLSIIFLPLKIARADFHITNILFGSYTTALYLGVIGMILGYMTKEISIGILVPFLYYFFEMFSKGRFTKNLYLFGMGRGNYISKIKLFSIATIAIIVFLFIIKKEISK